MSYTFTVRGSDKADAKAKVAAALTDIATKMENHKADVDAASSAANAYIDLLRDDAEQDVAVTMSGSVWDTGDGLRQVSVCVDASNRARG